MNTLPALALALIVLLVGPAPAQEAVSGGGSFSARIARAPGQERVAELLARRLLTVRSNTADPAGDPHWSCSYPEVPDATGHFLISDDGSTFVALTGTFAPARVVVRVFRFGEQVASYTGRDIDLGRGEFSTEDGRLTWLSGAEDRVGLAWRETLNGPSLVLELESTLGWGRVIDLTEGQILTGREASVPVLEPGVDPKLRGVVQVPRVDSFSLPDVALAGVPVELHVEGTHPVANWQLCGFTVDVLDLDGFDLRIVPQTRPPTPGTLPGQRLTGFRGQAALHGLAPGRYLIHVEGSEPDGLRLPAHTLEVLPARVRARLHTTGGIMGLDESIALFIPGVLRVTSSRSSPDDSPHYFQASPERVAELEQALFALALQSPGSRTTRGAADLFHFRLDWWAGDAWRSVEREEGTLEGPVGDLIQVLRRAAR